MLTKFGNLFACMACLVVLAFPAVAWGSGVLDYLPALSNEEIEHRLSFIERRLDQGRSHAFWWQYGWGGFFTATTVGNTAAGIASDDTDNQVNYFVDAWKSAMGLTEMVFRPLPGTHGADEIRAMPGETREEKLARLASAERQLRECAKRARAWTDWKNHFSNVLINLVGGAIIWGFGNGGDAAVSTGAGIAIGEIHLWSQPRQPAKDLKDYERQFGASQAKGVSLQVLPMMGGAMVRLTF